MRIGPGTQAGKYRIIKEIGRGGMGVVYLAEDTTLDRQIALKVLERNLTDPEQFEARFRQEARTLAKLQHPNIVYIHSLEKVEGLLAIDMPFIEGGALTELFASRAVRGEYVVKWVGEILDALDSCHQDGIIHRDVKPSNVLIGRGERALLSDFGLAKLLEEQQVQHMQAASSSGLFLGTPSYAPPELWEGTKPTPAWDVYSVGVVLYEGLTGLRPFTGNSPFLLLRQIMEQPVRSVADINPAISAAMSSAVMTMIDKNPANRPADAGEALQLLRQAPEVYDLPALNQPTVATRRPSIDRRKKSSIARMRWSVAARLRVTQWMTGILLVLLGAGMAWQWLPGLLAYGSHSRMPENTPSGDASKVFDTIDSSSTQLWKDHALLWPGKAAGTWTGLAWQGTHLWYLEQITEEAKICTVQGFWAEYQDETASLFNQGTISGSGQWIVGGSQIAVTLEFRNSADGTRKTRPLMLNLSNAQISSTEYMRRFSQSDFMTPLVFNEISLRALPWAPSFESDILARTSPILPIRGIPNGVPPPDVDGHMQESEWNVLFPVQSEGVSGIPPNAGSCPARLLTAFDKDNLYVAVEAMAPIAKPRVVLSLINEFQSPAPDSPHWLLVAETSGITTGTHRVNRQEEVWRPQCQVGVSAEGGSCSMEIKLPFSQMKDAPIPVPGTRWRLTCALYDGVDLEVPRAVWGDPMPSHPENGAIAVFQSAAGS